VFSMQRTGLGIDAPGVLHRLTGGGASRGSAKRRPMA
jgi:hypothetical protein